MNNPASPIPAARSIPLTQERTAESASTTPALQPMGWGPSILFFGIPAALSVLALYVVTPMLVRAGTLPFYAQFLPNGIVLISLLIASLVAYRSEGGLLTWSALRERFRISRMTGRMWLWVLIGTVGGFALYYLATPFGGWLIREGIIPLPASMPAWLDPRVTMSFVEKFSSEAGGLRGNWIGFCVAAISFFFNVVGEEFWWRGYVMPRNELAFGKWTWLIHGVMWSAIFHAFKYWDVVGLLPAHLFFVYIVSRTKSTTVAMLLHSLTNISFPIFVLLGVLGIGL